MPFRKMTLAACVAACVATYAGAQTTPAAPAATPAPAAKPAVESGSAPHWVRPETAEHRKARLGTAEDPGPNPDPAKHYWRYGKLYHIEKFERKWAYDADQPLGWIRPMAMVNVAFEIYQLDDASVWVWVPDPDPAKAQEPPAPAAYDPDAQPRPEPTEIDAPTVAFLNRIRSEYSAIEPAVSDKTIAFRNASEGLPEGGNWRNTIEVADMNGDGFMDLIVPAERGATSSGSPSVFLGDGKGHWKFWDKLRLPHSVQYGSVVAADFNRDGHMDLAVGVHLTGIFVFLGDGKGKFTEVYDGVPRDDFGTRRLRIADVDNDGWPDIVGVSEGPSARGTAADPFGPIRVWLNRKHGTAFEGVNVADVDRKVGGDSLAVGDMNGDKVPDIAAASIYFNSWDVLYLSNKGKLKWTPYEKNDGNIVPSLAYYFGNAMGHFSSKRDDAILSYVRIWPNNVDEKLVAKPAIQQITSIERFSVTPSGTLTRTPIMRWSGGDEIRGLAAADVDGDGNLDVVFVRTIPRELVVLLGDGKGGFKRAGVRGVTLLPNTNYDLVVRDVNGDGRPDVVISYAATDVKNALAARNGAIQVFLNEGAAAGSGQQPAAGAKKEAAGR